MDNEKCQWAFACERYPTLVVRTGAHNDPKAMCKEHADITSKSLRDQGYYACIIPIGEENGKHPERDPESMFYLRNKAYKDSTDRYVVRCNDFEAASKYAAANGWEKREWSWFPAYTLNKTIQIFERKS
jgi:hypothetical protein